MTDATIIKRKEEYDEKHDEKSMAGVETVLEG